jgi:hypothetical protein
MRTGLALSVFLHVGLFLAALIGLPAQSRPQPLTDIEVPVEIARLDEKPNPPPGEKPKPETPKAQEAEESTAKSTAEEGGKTEPRRAEREMAPAPPVARPLRPVQPPKPPEPVKPPETHESAMLPPPPPKEEPKKEPPKPPEPEVKPQPKPQPAAKPEKAPEPKAAEKAPPKAPEAKEHRETKAPNPSPKPAEFEAVLRTIDQLRKAPKEAKEERAAKPVAPGAPTHERGRPLSESEKDSIRRQIQPCWNFPAGAKDPRSLRVEIQVWLERDGRVRDLKVLDERRMARDAYYRAAAEAAIRALRNPRCTPLRIPAEKYESWKSIIFNFDPRDMN